MARSERYIAPSAKELQRLRQLEATARAFAVEREKLLRAALGRMKKAELVEIAMRVASEHETARWALEREAAPEKPVDLLVHDTSIAIDAATRVDEEKLNRNPEINWAAYDAVRRGFLELIGRAHIEHAKSLALRLAQEGSHQIEWSDEGLMQEEIERCLEPVVAAAAHAPAVRTWACDILRLDRTGCICRQELTALSESNS